MNFLVTGGEGFIGSHTVELLLSEGHTVTVVDDRSAPENQKFHRFEGASYLLLDVNDIGIDTFSDIDVVIHLAARSRIQPSYRRARHTYSNNVMGTQQVLDCCIQAGVKRIVYAGSSSCYGLTNVPPFKEGMTPDCLNHYALSKYEGELLCKQYSKMEGLESVTLRYFNVYGPREPLVGPYAPVIGLFKRQRDAGDPLTIVGDGEQRRDFTFVSDVARANYIAATSPSTDLFKNDSLTATFNVGTGRNFSVNEIADMVGGKRIYIDPRPGEARVTLADTTAFTTATSWRSTVDLPSIINAY